MGRQTSTGACREKRKSLDLAFNVSVCRAQQCAEINKLYQEKALVQIIFSLEEKCLRFFQLCLWSKVFTLELRD